MKHGLKKLCVYRGVDIRQLFLLSVANSALCSFSKASIWLCSLMTASDTFYRRATFRRIFAVIIYTNDFAHSQKFLLAFTTTELNLRRKRTYFKNVILTVLAQQCKSAFLLLEKFSTREPIESQTSGFRISQEVFRLWDNLNKWRLHIEFKSLMRIFSLI